jgi:hypothetical protein
VCHPQGRLLLDRLARGRAGSLLVQEARPGGGDLTQRRSPALETRRRRRFTWLECHPFEDRGYR